MLIENSTMLIFLSIWKMKMTRNAAANGNSTSRNVVGLLDPTRRAVPQDQRNLKCIFSLVSLKADKKHLLIVHNLLGNTFVLLEDWDRHY